MVTVPREKRRVLTEPVKFTKSPTKMPEKAFVDRSWDKLPNAIMNVASVVDKANKKAEDSVVRGLVANYIKNNNKLLYNVNDGYYTQKGKNSLANFNDYEKRSQQYKEQLGSGLSGSMREKFETATLNEGVAFNKQMNRHSFKEMQDYERDQTKASLDTYKEDGILNYLVPGKLDQTVTRLNEQVDIFGANEGMSEKDIKTMKQDEREKLYVGVVGRMVTNGQDRLAKDTVQELKGKKIVGGVALTKLEKLIQTSSNLGESQRVADKVWANDKLNLQEKLAYVRKNYEGEVEDQVLARLKGMSRETDYATTQKNKQDFLDMYNIAEKTLRLPDKKYAKTWQELKPPQRDTIRRLVSGEQFTTDPVVYQNLKLMAAHPDTRNKFMQSNLLDYRTKLSSPDFKKMVDLKARMMKGDDSSLDMLRSQQRVIGDKLDEFGIGDAKKQALFSSALEAASMEWQREHPGKDINHDTLEDLADKLMMKFEIENGIFDLAKRAYEMKGGETIDEITEGESIGGYLELIVNKGLKIEKNVYEDITEKLSYNDIPEKMRKQIAEALKAEGTPYTPETVLLKVNEHLKGLVVE